MFFKIFFFFSLSATFHSFFPRLSQNRKPIINKKKKMSAAAVNPAADVNEDNHDPTEDDPTTSSATAVDVDNAALGQDTDNNASSACSPPASVPQPDYDIKGELQCTGNVMNVIDIHNNSVEPPALPATVCLKRAAPHLFSNDKRPNSNIAALRTAAPKMLVFHPPAATDHGQSLASDMTAALVEQQQQQQQQRPQQPQQVRPTHLGHVKMAAAASGYQRPRQYQLSQPQPQQQQPQQLTPTLFPSNGPDQFHRPHYLQDGAIPATPSPMISSSSSSISMAGSAAGSLPSSPIAAFSTTSIGALQERILGERERFELFLSPSRNSNFTHPKNTFRSLQQRARSNHRSVSRVSEVCVCF